jgi:hypothetical protein
VDPDSKLAVFRTDLGQGVSMITIPDERRLPNVNDDLYLVAPDRSGIEAIYHAELDQVVGRGEPDEVLAIGLKGVPVTQDSMLGRAVVDEKGRFSGLVVGMSPEGRAICTAATRCGSSVPKPRRCRRTLRSLRLAKKQSHRE